MNPQPLPRPSLNQIERRRRKRERFTSLVIHLAMFALLFIVLSPLLWMILTAFKQRGQGMSLSFIPSTTVVIEAEPLRWSPAGDEFNLVTFELPDPDRQWSQVAVAGGFNEWSSSADPMVWLNGSWIRSFVNEISEGRWEYKFVANGDQWMGDPGNLTDGDPGANSVIVVEGNSTSNIPLTDATRIENGQVLIDYAAPDLTDPVADVRMLDIWQEVPLTLEDGRWRGSTGLPEIARESVDDGEPDIITFQRRYRSQITFSEAWDRTYTLANFRAILTDPDYPFGRFFLNSCVVATGCGLVTVILCLLAGYAFAVKEFWGRDQIFWLLFASMLIPGLVFVVPQFAIVNALGWRNSYQGMILPHVANVFGMFLMRQYIRTLPRDLFSAARVDGASEVQVLSTIVVPLAMPIIVTLFLLTFMLQWSNFLWQLIVVSPTSPLRTLPVGLALFRGQHQIDWELMMAGGCFSVVPIAILFIVAQRYFIQGLTAGAVKG